MEKETTGTGPQNTRKTPAEVVWVWEGGQALELPTEEMPQEMPNNYPVPVDDLPYVEVKRAPLVQPDPVYYVEPALEFLPWVAVTTVKVLKFSLPFAIGAGVLYVGYIGLSWLVAQTMFWVCLVAAVFVLVMLSFFLESLPDRSRPKIQDKRPSAGNVVTNVHVNGVHGDVITNVFVNLKKEGE